MVALDSNVVNKRIRQALTPALKELGFASFTSRTVRRYFARRIDVINFQSFNSYMAEGLGCTTYSFAINLGIAFNFVPPCRVKVKDGKLLPNDYDCHFRRTLEKRFFQKECPRDDLWYVAADGTNLEEVVGEAVSTVLDDGIPWFDRVGRVDEGLRVLLNDQESGNRLFGFGAEGSPRRNFLTGCFALAFGDTDLARTKLNAAADAFPSYRTDVETLLATIA